MFGPLSSSFSSSSSFINLEITWFDVCLKISEKMVMDNHTFGEVFESDAPRRTRPSRSSSRVRPSYNQDLITPRFGNDGARRGTLLVTPSARCEEQAVSFPSVETEVIELEGGRKCHTGVAKIVE